jgi:hypothetical protein
MSSIGQLLEEMILKMILEWGSVDELRIPKSILFPNRFAFVRRWANQELRVVLFLITEGNKFFWDMWPVLVQWQDDRIILFLIFRFLILLQDKTSVVEMFISVEDLYAIRYLEVCQG